MSDYELNLPFEYQVLNPEMEWHRAAGLHPQRLRLAFPRPPGPLPRRHETILASRRNGPETKVDYQRPKAKETSMIEIFTAIMGLFSAAVFAAHTVDAYRAN